MMSGTCNHCMGWTTLVIGALVLLNEFMLGWTWAMFIGWLLVLKGFVGVFIPNNCPNCNAMSSSGKRRK